MASMIEIAISHVSADGKQYYQELSVPVGTTVMQAIGMSDCCTQDTLAWFGAWCDEHQTDEPNHKAWYVGIYSQKVRLDTVLTDGDRVEIYRALTIDPMAKRKSKSKVTLKKLGYKPL